MSKISNRPIEKADAKHGQSGADTATRESATREGVIDLLKREGCDGVVAFGGGSAMDAAKVMAIAAANRRPIWIDHHGFKRTTIVGQHTMSGPGF